MRIQKLGDIATVAKAAINPIKLTSQQVDHYSLPAYDRGAVPERVDPATIKSSKLLITEPVVLVSKLNPSTPRIWLASPGEVPALASTEFVPLTPTGIEISTLFGICKSSHFQNQLKQLVTGTSNSHQRVPITDMLSIAIPAPLSEVTTRVGELVTLLEKRIWLSRSKVNSADKLISELFASSFPTSGEPTDELGEYIEVQTGVSYTSKDFGGENQALVTLKSFGRDGAYNPNGLKAWSGEFKKAQQVMPGEILVAHTDISQQGDVLGRGVSVRESDDFDVLVASMDLAVVRPKHTLTNEFLLGLTRQTSFRNFCKSRSNGTTVLHLQRSAIKEHKFRLPTLDEITKYSEAVNKLLVAQNFEESTQRKLLTLQRLKLAQHFS